MAIGLLSAIAAFPAVADPIGGATYTGIAADGADVAFTLSPDGTLVTSYQITTVPDGGCLFDAEGHEGAWEGAPVVVDTFGYNLYDAISFRGTFAGPKSASGTFRLFNRAAGAAPACDTGTVSWSATTNATPPLPGAGGSGGGSGTNPGGAGHGGTGANGAKHKFATRIGLRKLSRRLVGGQIKSALTACRGSRTVVLWRGSRRIASTRSKRNGSYSFRRSGRVRGRRVRVSTPARSIRAGLCAAGSSIFIRA